MYHLRINSDHKHKVHTRYILFLTNTMYHLRKTVITDIDYFSLCHMIQYFQICDLILMPVS